MCVRKIQEILETLLRSQAPSLEELTYFIENMDAESRIRLREASGSLRDEIFGRRVYFRGLIEFTNYCSCNCFYCGLRRDNENTARYRLSLEQILSCCETGHALGYRSFVLQGGEDPYFTDDRMIELVGVIRAFFSDCAITISIGERSRESYRKIFDAGANRCLLRHETADPEHYGKLHPPEQSLENRMRCLRDLKEIGYQVGAGFMVGSPWQTAANLAKDLLFLHDFKPHMIGIGPFLPHHETPFARFAAGSLETSIDMLAMTRLLVPRALLPATTALGSLSELGREMGLRAGANVVMPNLSPTDVRKLYSIYDNKKSAGNEAAESLSLMKEQLIASGFEPDMSRGDWTDGAD